jgi:hypothetical protein
VIFDVDREALFAGVETWPARYGPALHHTVEFQPQIVVQATRRVLLDHEGVASAAALPAARLRSDVEFSLFAVNIESHGLNSRDIGVRRRLPRQIAG